MSEKALHSILVKSIPCSCSDPADPYWSLHSILVKSIRYDWICSRDAHGALHSILVKSIRFEGFLWWWFESLYIPFWLNLYEIVSRFMRRSLTLHSILVKSILFFTLSPPYALFSLHSILVKSIPKTINS